MKVWLIWVQVGTDATWLEAAMDDDTTTEGTLWHDEVDRVRKLVADNPGYEMRIQAVEVPGVFALFEIPTVKAAPA